VKGDRKFNLVTCWTLIAIYTHISQTTCNFDLISVAVTAATAWCNYYTCDNSLIVISQSSTNTPGDCYWTCGPNANAYSWAFNILTMMCSCYSASCCGSSYAVYSPYIYGGIIGKHISRQLKFGF